MAMGPVVHGRNHLRVRVTGAIRGALAGKLLGKLQVFLRTAVKRVAQAFHAHCQNAPPRCPACKAPLDSWT